jgi:MYXO-CTERM domain-containing protein
MTQLRWGCVLLGAAAAEAHQGGTVSKALFTNPAAPTALPSDGGLMLAPYTFASADAQFTVQWNVDLPSDPTGNFSFYYLDHMPPSGVTYDQIIVQASPIPEASGDNTYWVSCSCDADAGVVCPDLAVRTHCSLTQFNWDTHAVPAGAYWLIAANFDYPYKIYSVSPGPVRIAHGAAELPPAAVVVLPDGLFATDKSYNTVWLATGKPPLHFDVFYGINNQTNALDAPTVLGQDITPIVNADGSYSYVWDTSALVEGFYYFGVKVTDATGQSTFTDSQLGENVFHPPADGGLIFSMDSSVRDLTASPDLTHRTVPSPDGGCSCGVAGDETIPLAAGLLAALLLALALRSRRSPPG